MNIYDNVCKMIDARAAENTEFYFFLRMVGQNIYYEINIQMKQLKIIRQFTLIEKGFEYPLPDLYSLIFPSGLLIGIFMQISAHQQ